MPRSIILFNLLAIFAAASGCGQNEEIRRYTVPKQEEIDQLAGNLPAADKGGPASSESSESQRMLAAIVLRPSQAWFFKFVGDPKGVAEHADEFNALLKSVHFSDDATPEWSLPAGWTRQAGNQFRYATLAIGGTSLEVSVSALDWSGTEETEYVLSNINRWRGQVGLDPIAANELAEETKQIEIADGTATLVDFTGHGSSGSMSPPFAGRQPAVSPPTADGPANLKYEVPAGWQEEPASGFRKASFKIHADGETGDVSVSDLAAAAGDLLPNVNRWRGQVGLEPMTQAEVEKQAETMDVGTRQGQYIEMIGDEKATLGVIVTTDDRAWFIKLTGEKKLVERQRENFKAFVHSLAIGEN